MHHTNLHHDWLRRSRAILALSTVIVASGFLEPSPLIAQDKVREAGRDVTPTPEPSNQRVESSVDPTSPKADQQLLVSAKNLSGATLVDQSGADLGDVGHVYMSVDGKLVHLTTSLGSVLGVGGREIAIPLSAVGLRNTDDADSPTAWLSIDMNKEMVQKAPPLEARNLLELRDAAWVAQNAKFFNVPDSNISQSSAERSLLIPATDLVSHAVLGRGDTATIAHVEDVLLSLGKQNSTEPAVRYAILGYGGTLGLGKEYVAIPFDEVVVTLVNESELKVEVPYNSKSLAEQQHVTPSGYPELKLSSVRRRIENQPTPAPR